MIGLDHGIFGIDGFYMPDASKTTLKDHILNVSAFKIPRNLNRPIHVVTVMVFVSARDVHERVIRYYEKLTYMR
ncbi:MAG: hypothetical protein HQL84_06630 [Magnetococcales bacterium]|nr:hypothetical protein [Magnetococcales bacterium]MBF0149708.1 hypothetical protein [Magnetococcales bacterium]MBF0174077.1 hypothetical protein [Magnetococcales bacterium]MBF0630757.1 hypothetical protein [Magnetococcales bacterium]